MFNVHFYDCFMLQRNAVSQDNETFKKLQELMTPRDPFYKPDAKSPDGDAQSLAG